MQSAHCLQIQFFIRKGGLFDLKCPKNTNSIISQKPTAKGKSNKVKISEAGDGTFN